MATVQSISLALVASLAVACGASSTPGTTPVASRDDGAGHRARDIAVASPLRGPFASWEEICGPLAHGTPGDDDATIERRERCTIEATTLASGGPFLGIATYYEGAPSQGSSYLALRTARGWFVTEIPDGRPFGGGLSHHTPAWLAFDAASTRFEDGVLRVVARGSASSFVPGQGPLGSTSQSWTDVTQCGARDGIVVCAAPEEIHRETCHVTGELPDRLERTCEQHGEDIPPAEPASRAPDAGR